MKTLINMLILYVLVAIGYIKDDKSKIRQEMKSFVNKKRDNFLRKALSKANYYKSFYDLEYVHDASSAFFDVRKVHLKTRPTIYLMGSVMNRIEHMGGEGLRYCFEDYERFTFNTTYRCMQSVGDGSNPDGLEAKEINTRVFKQFKRVRKWFLEEYLEKDIYKDGVKNYSLEGHRFLKELEEIFLSFRLI